MVDVDMDVVITEDHGMLLKKKNSLDFVVGPVALLNQINGQRWVIFFLKQYRNGIGKSTTESVCSQYLH